MQELNYLEYFTTDFDLWGEHQSNCYAIDHNILLKMLDAKNIKTMFEDTRVSRCKSRSSGDILVNNVFVY